MAGSLSGIDKQNFSVRIGSGMPSTSTPAGSLCVDENNGNTWVIGTEKNVQLQDGNKAPISHASTATTYGVSTASNYGHTKASSTTPKANGTAAVGSETSSFARGDHVHPLQTTISGNAGSASKLTTNTAGSATQPVYFNDGVPVATTYTLSASVPANAKFTDTVYSLPLATSSVRGGVKIGYTASGKNYPVQLSNEQMYVNVPWTDTNTWTAFKGATASAAGTAGYIPAPSSGQTSLYFRSDGTWATPPNTTYGVATTSANGLMSSTDKSKLDGIATNANNYSLPSATSSVRGGVKIGSNITISSDTISITKANVTSALGYTPPTTNTTYSAMTGATASAAGTTGLVPAPAAGKQTSFLRGDGTWVIPTNTDTKVTQGAAITANSNLAVLLAYNTSATAITNTVNRASLTYNPSTKVMDYLILDGGSID